MSNQKPTSKNTAIRTKDVYSRAIKEAVDREIASIKYAGYQKDNNK